MVVRLACRFLSAQVKAADFERIKLFGEGGSGLVYLVKLKNTSMYFALKASRAALRVSCVSVCVSLCLCVPVYLFCVNVKSGREVEG